MSAIAELLSQVKLGEPQVHLNLALYPLMGTGYVEPGYRLLDEALASGCARITEVSQAGSVPDLSLVNGCDLPVLLLDGEELVGAKQNRILNLSILAPAKETLVVPVSCVEAGRWRAQSSEFASASRAHFATGRARKAAQVSFSMRETGSRRSDQSEVWLDIADKALRMDAQSETAAASALYGRHRGTLDEYRAAFTPVAGQVGALFAIDGKVIGLDLFDSELALQGLLGKLIESYALDAIDAGVGSSNGEGTRAPDEFLAAVAATEKMAFPAIGLGEDVRLQGAQVAGGALIAWDRVVHLCAFRLPQGDDSSRGQSRHGFARASVRRRGRFVH